jgi:RimJ/RimL family protein N-acetyltransferase
VISLRPVAEADLDVFYEHQADRLASQMAAFPSRERAAHIEHWTKRVFADPLNRSRTVLVDGAVAGNVVSWIDAESGHRLLGYWIGREFWGRGIATEALGQFLAEFTDRPVFADVVAHNIGSQRVLEKNGFVRVSQETIAGSDGIEELEFVLR